LGRKEVQTKKKAINIFVFLVLGDLWLVLVDASASKKYVQSFAFSIER